MICIFERNELILHDICHLMKKIVKILLFLALLTNLQNVFSQERVYKCEFGLQGGIGYYVGDATQHVFNYPHAAAAGSFRYKFTRRWALQVKGGWQRIRMPLQMEQVEQLSSNDIASIDVTAEFNFFRFGELQYDRRVKPITPYIFLGIGAAAYNGYSNFAAYLPFGLGMKWKFAPRWGLTLAWQHNLFFADNLENNELYNNTYQLNGSNFMKNDLTSTLMLGLVFEFSRQRTACRMCY